MAVDPGNLRTEDGVAACSTPEGLQLVDAAFERSGSREAHELKKHYCRGCEIRDACLVAGMIGEWGVWGGTGQRQRTQAGARRPIISRRRAA